MATPNHALSVVPVATLAAPVAAVGALEFTADQKAMIRDTFANGASDGEFAVLLEVARVRRLNPMLRQIHFVQRWDSEKHRMVWSTQVSIDGLRAIAERTGLYQGQGEPEFVENPDGTIKLCKVRVYRRDWPSDRPAVGVAYWNEFVQTTRDKQTGKSRPTAMWARMPHVMLAKCFDEQTEVLTDRGFQRFSEVTGRVLEVTSQGLAPTDARPFVQHYDGEMVTLASDDLNFCVTPNHDMLTTAGKIEAGAMYEAARARPRHRIPRSVKGSREHGVDMTLAAIELAAAYLCDGSDSSETSFLVAVSRTRKVKHLRGLAMHHVERTVTAHPSAPRESGRTVVTRTDKTGFAFRFDLIRPLCGPGKQVSSETILAMSRTQARAFVDAMLAFDGHRDAKSGVRRFFTSRVSHREAFELAAVIAGYSVSPWRERASDLSERPNFYVTVSDRDAIPVVRWGRAYRGDRQSRGRKHTGLEMTRNTSGVVWCVTVPSGVIVVRRNGFSMLCGNCAESLALRKAFPEDMSGLFTPDEMAQADVIDAPSPSTDVPARQINADVRAEPAAAPVVAAPAVPFVEVVNVPLPAAPPAAAPTTTDDDAPPVDPPAPPETRVERDAANDVDAPPAELEPYYTALAEIELAGECVGVWMKHRAAIAKTETRHRNAAWEALIRRTEHIGHMKNARVWLKKAVAEEDARALAKGVPAAG